MFKSTIFQSVITMDAIVKKQATKGFWLEQRQMPTINNTEVLIRIIKTAICGTDVHIYKWDDWAAKTIPIGNTAGHEFVGEVVEVGSDVKNIKVGMIVSGEGHITCESCRNCLAGRMHQCSNTKGIGVNLPGAFAEYLKLPYQNVWIHKPNIDLDIASMFDPFGNAVHSVLQFNLVGEDVLITGAGPIGLMATAVCKYVGARNIVVTDINQHRLNLAMQMGATKAVNPQQVSLAEVKQQLGIVEGFDVGIEMSGNSHAFQQLVANMTHGGNIALLGIHTSQSTIDWEQVIFKMLTIKGIYGREIFETWYKMSVMIEKGVDISPIISHRFHYTEFQQGFDVIEAGEAGKVILNWS